jgi:hypothetical protein
MKIDRSLYWKLFSAFLIFVAIYLVLIFLFFLLAGAFKAPNLALVGAMISCSTAASLSVLKLPADYRVKAACGFIWFFIGLSAVTFIYDMAHQKSGTLAFFNMIAQFLGMFMAVRSIRQTELRELKRGMPKKS